MKEFADLLFKPAELDFSTIPNITEHEIDLRIDLAIAYRLVAINGWDDHIYTHISAALDDASSAYLINSFGLLFSEVTPVNLAKVSVSGEVLFGDAINKTGFTIHGAVHRYRPDAKCVMHLHNSAAIAISALKEGLLPISQHALRFYRDIAYFDYSGLAIDSGSEIQMIEALSDKKALLLKNHGSLICGHSIQQAFYLMDVLNKACEIQLLTRSSQTSHPSEAICNLTFDQLVSDGDQEGQIEWPAYVRKLMTYQQ